MTSDLEPRPAGAAGPSAAGAAAFAAAEPKFPRLVGD
jgi:hypothetical protein